MSDYNGHSTGLLALCQHDTYVKTIRKISTLTSVNVNICRKHFMALNINLNVNLLILIVK